MGAVARYLMNDHDRLDALLARATADSGHIDTEAFAAFRKGLLRHIGLEEKILLPAAREALGRPVEGADRLRANHMKIVALMVPSPTHALVAQLREILVPHNEFEEAPGGVYEACERLAAGDPTLLDRLRGAPEVPVRPHFDGRLPVVLGGPGAAPARPG